MQYHEGDTDEVIAKLLINEEHEQQLSQATRYVSALYAFEHRPLTIADIQHKKIVSFWQESASHVGEKLKEPVEQLGLVLGHVYELEADEGYTIADRIQIQKNSSRRGVWDQESDPLAERFIHDITVARLSLEGNLRNPKKIAEISYDTRRKIGAQAGSLESTVRAGIRFSREFFPKPSSALGPRISH